MESQQLERFKVMFREQKHQILSRHQTMEGELQVESDRQHDELDQVSNDLEKNMQVQIQNRQKHYLEKIDQALQRIHEGSFGECLDCGEPIAIRRLEARPTTTLCLTCQEVQERMQKRM